MLAPSPCGVGFFYEKLLKMKKVISLIDGFNLYHSIADISEFRKYKWLNLRKLSECFLKKDEELTEVSYFTAYANWNPAKVAKHKVYVNALKTVKVNTIVSEFRVVEKFCSLCSRKYKAHEEKRTDVQIAINLFKGAIQDLYDKAVVISADSDLAPAIEVVKSLFPSKEIHLIIPIGRRAEFLKQIVDFYSKIKVKHLASSQFDEIIHLGDGATIQKPTDWT